jgi:hypothetical protein
MSTPNQVTLTPTASWSTINMLPVRYSVDASEEAQEVVLPDPTSITGGQTQLSIHVSDVTEAVTVVCENEDVTVNGEESLTIEVAGFYLVTIGNETNWLVTASYVPVDTEEA